MKTSSVQPKDYCLITFWDLINDAAYQFNWLFPTLSPFFFSLLFSLFILLFQVKFPPHSGKRLWVISNLEMNMRIQILHFSSFLLNHKMIFNHPRLAGVMILIKSFWFFCCYIESCKHPCIFLHWRVLQV